MIKFLKVKVTSLESDLEVEMKTMKSDRNHKEKNN